MKSVASIVLNNFLNDSRVLKEAITLKNNGYDVKVVALHENQLKEYDEIEGIAVHRIKLQTKNWAKNKAAQLFKYFEFMRKIVKKYKNMDIIHCHDLNALPIGVWIKVFHNKNVKVVYDAHEFETERTGTINPLLKRALVLLEKTLIKKADEVITVNESIADQYSERYGVDPIIICNTPPHEEVNKNNYFREKFNIPEDHLIFLYQGGLNAERGLASVLDAFKQLNGKKVALIFMGYGSFDEEIKRAGKQYSHIFYHPAVPRNQILQHTTSADIGLNYIENNCLNYYYCLPNKFFEYCMAGIPVLSNNLFEVRRLIEKYDCGFVYDEKVETLDSFIEREILNGYDVQRMRENTKQFSEVFNWENEEKKLIAMYKKITE